MKTLLHLLLSLLKTRSKVADSADDAVFQHLDGAEFSVVLPGAAAAEE